MFSTRNTFDKKNENTWAVDNTYDFYFSGRSSNSGGICIMVEKLSTIMLKNIQK